MATIAGHTFVETPDGRRCEVCKKLWVDVSGATDEDVDKPGWAHQGNLTKHELGQIRAEVDRLWELGRGA